MIDGVVDMRPLNVSSVTEGSDVKTTWLVSEAVLISSEVVSNFSEKANVVLVELNVGDVELIDLLKVVCSVESIEDVVISVVPAGVKIVVLISDGSVERGTLGL